MKRAVCVVLQNDTNQYLAVSRKDNLKDFGFPGGKLDEGETLLEAIKRETLEETGLEITDLQKIYEGYDEHDYLVTCYSAKWMGKIKTTEVGLVQWVNKEVLITESSSSFSKYNFKIFSELEFLQKVKQFELACHALNMPVDFKVSETLYRIHNLIDKKGKSSSIEDLVEIDYLIKTKYDS